MTHKITLSVSLLPSALCLADALSRVPKDRGDYKLHPPVFQQTLRFFSRWVQPTLDMFASPGNRQLERFACRYPHWEAELVDSLSCSLSTVRDCYANPPWTLISQWLNRLVENPHINCMLITPYWDSAVWWPLLLKLRRPECPSLIIPPQWGLFQDCWGTHMPPTRWPLIGTQLSGSCYKKKACPLRLWTLT